MSDRPIMTVVRTCDTAILPRRGSNLAAGYDLTSVEAGYVLPNSRACFSTGLKFMFPQGCYGRIASRSGLSLKNGIEVGAGTIDEDYRGVVKIILFNFSDCAFEVKVGDRIGQLIVEKYYTPKVIEVTEEQLSKTDRGEGGFGSTGICYIPTVQPSETGNLVVKEWILDQL